MTRKEAADFGNRIKTATPEEYRRLVKERDERRAEKNRKFRAKKEEK